VGWGIFYYLLEVFPFTERSGGICAESEEEREDFSLKEVEKISP